ncbi:hypothetical protein [Mesorhizobium sp. INR15]|uniref:hypothetical protein n=1 Tax=Mesorhizobium sp. INR15 TaxID=2654248 RepID=UPI0018968581|nr:hypothetical protein [Mesorhizobium sp. INR15]QPC90301.1 hypothetical protein GA829_06690 [Mesorhizobium sp. INR15]
MTTLNEALLVIGRRLGFPVSRGKTVARRLQETARLPSGAPGKAPEIDSSDFVTLLLALAADTELHLTVEALDRLAETVPHGVDTAVMPEGIRLPPVTARSYLETLAWKAASDDPDLQSAVSKLKIEVVSTWPEIAIHFPDGDITRFRQTGELAAHWGDARIRKSITISGAAFVDAVRDLNIKD